jgi:hypothetical protein
VLENLISKWLLSDSISYVAPSVALASLFLFERRRWSLVNALHFSGVFVHELFHFLVGLVTMARPTSFSLIPRSEGGRLFLGSVGFVGLNWLNAWVTAAAPLLALPIIFSLATWRLESGPQHVQFWDVLVWLFIAPHFLHCWPSRADWKLVLISWPLAALLGMIFVLWTWARG